MAQGLDVPMLVLAAAAVVVVPAPVVIMPAVMVVPAVVVMPAVAVVAPVVIAAPVAGPARRRPVDPEGNGPSDRHLRQGAAGATLVG